MSRTIRRNSKLYKSILAGLAGMSYRSFHLGNNFVADDRTDWAMRGGLAEQVAEFCERGLRAPRITAKEGGAYTVHFHGNHWIDVKPDTDAAAA